MSSVDATYRQILANLPARDVAQPATPAPAVACVLWRREDSPEGLREQVFLAQRGPDVAFLGGTWCFPGGRVEASDDNPLSAAARELLEETGLDIDLVRHPLRTAGRWITPALSPRRFDTTYYLLEIPPGPEPDVSVSGGELVAGEWMTATSALDRWCAGELALSSPVWRVLQVLAAGVSAATDEAFDAAASAEARARMWDVFPGVAMCPLKTPTLPPATHTNCVIVGGRDLVVIDPATPYAEHQAILDGELARLESAGRRVRAVWLTHHHADHVGAANWLAEARGVPVAAHRETARLLAGRVKVDVELEDGHVEALSGHDAAGVPARRLRCLFTPGHAPGHLCFVEETTRTVVAGDMVAGVGTILIDPDEGDMTRYLASIEQMLAEQPRTVIPAHGGPMTQPRPRLEALIRHRLWREQAVLGALGATAQPPGELVKVAYRDVPPAVWPLAARSLLSHLLKLEAEGRARRDGDSWLAAAGSTKTDD